MKRYIVPRNKRQHLVVSDDVHQAVSLYATQRDISLCEATYHLLKLGLVHEYDLPIPDYELEKYEIKKPSVLDFRRWFRHSE